MTDDDRLLLCARESCDWYGGREQAAKIITRQIEAVLGGPLRLLRAYDPSATARLTKMLRQTEESGAWTLKNAIDEGRFDVTGDNDKEDSE
jgi:hypothetical protein